MYRLLYCVMANLMICSAMVRAAESECYGSTSSGRLERGVLLPSKGKNFVAYSSIARAMGRTYVHSAVFDIVVRSYQSLEITQPTKVFKYAETGFKEGGKFKPHKTHQNGLSVDFMVPVLDNTGASTHLPTHPFNKFGYNIEFDAFSKYDEYEIDYEAMAGHIVALDQQAKKAGYGLWRVIFDPELQPNLYTTSFKDYLTQHIQFSQRPSWVRHDEHYHVDFDIPCK